MADENFPLVTVKRLRQEGFDVSSVREIQPGADDKRVLVLCAEQDRVLITLDKDFGELAFRQGLVSPRGILLFRLTPQDPEELAQLALDAFGSRSEWSGYFGVITRKSIRVRPLIR